MAAPVRHGVGPRLRRAAPHSGPGEPPGLSRLHATVPGGGAAVSSWAFELTLAGRRAAVMTARKGGNGLEFDATRFVAAVQALVARFAEPTAAD